MADGATTASSGSQANGVTATSASGGGLVNSIGSYFKSLFNNPTPSQFNLPMPNVLSGFASYNYLFSMYCLDPDSFNYPLSSYLAGQFPPTILSSAFRNPDNRFGFAGQQFDFFLDEVNITSQYGFEKGTGNTNVTNIEFKVVEPYSLGAWMIAMQAAAYNAGYQNYNEAIFLLVIEFRGNTEDGVLALVPNTTKYIPFKLNTISVKATAAGAVYNVVGLVANAGALDDSYKQLKSNATINGTTVQEILQTGTESLQNVVNARFQQLQKDGAVTVADEILILFPPNISTSTTGTFLIQPNAATQSTQAPDNAQLLKQLGVTRSSTTQLLVQDPSQCNALGSATLGFDVTRTGQRPHQDANNVWDVSKKIWVRGKTNSKPGEVAFMFSQGSDIVNAINQVLLKSSAAAAALDPSLINNTTGMRPWWRIDTQAYYVSSTANMKQTGQVPKLMVYRVVPYQVHASQLLLPNAPAPGFSNGGLKAQVAKIYDYLYTGLNTEVKNFDITVENTFYQSFMADNYKRTADSVTQAQQGMTAETKQQQQINLQPGLSSGSSAEGFPAYQAKYDAITSSHDRRGGSRGETEISRAAKLFHDSMVKGMDMMNASITINGDPYYIANSGMGNYTANQTDLINVTSDGDINYQNGEVDIIVNFRTPSDINQVTGMYDRKSALCEQFSGFYKITTIESKFKSGVFEQTLTVNRRQGQDSTATFDPKTDTVNNVTSTSK